MRGVPYSAEHEVRQYFASSFPSITLLHPRSAFQRCRIEARRRAPGPLFGSVGSFREHKVQWTDVPVHQPRRGCWHL